jgi:hypothetical protein
MASKDEKAERKRLKDEYLRAQQEASAARMPLDRAQLESLLDHIEAAVEANGCDHTLVATEAWAAAPGKRTRGRQPEVSLDAGRVDAGGARAGTPVVTKRDFPTQHNACCRTHAALRVGAARRDRPRRVQ